jgi:predicted transcriptional regulator
MRLRTGKCQRARLPDFEGPYCAAPLAELAAAGRTTRQIAATLFLSPKTVEGHLTSVFRKLRIASRSELGSRLAAGGGQERLSREP